MENSAYNAAAAGELEAIACALEGCAEDMAGVLIARAGAAILGASVRGVLSPEAAGPIMAAVPKPDAEPSAFRRAFEAAETVARRTWAELVPNLPPPTSQKLRRQVERQRQASVCRIFAAMIAATPHQPAEDFVGTLKEVAAQLGVSPPTARTKFKLLKLEPHSRQRWVISAGDMARAREMLRSTRRSAKATQKTQSIRPPNPCGR